MSSHYKTFNRVVVSPNPDLTLAAPHRTHFVPLFGILELLLSRAFAFRCTLHVTFCGPTGTTQVKGGPRKCIMSREVPEHTRNKEVIDTASVVSWFRGSLLIAANCVRFQELSSFKVGEKGARAQKV